jgi:hypothetical protein
MPTLGSRSLRVQGAMFGGDRVGQSFQGRRDRPQRLRQRYQLRRSTRLGDPASIRAISSWGTARRQRQASGRRTSTPALCAPVWARTRVGRFPSAAEMKAPLVPAKPAAPDAGVVGQPVVRATVAFAERAATRSRHLISASRGQQRPPQRPVQQHGGAALIIAGGRATGLDSGINLTRVLHRPFLRTVHHDHRLRRLTRELAAPCGEKPPFRVHVEGADNLDRPRFTAWLATRRSEPCRRDDLVVPG